MKNLNAQYFTDAIPGIIIGALVGHYAYTKKFDGNSFLKLALPVIGALAGAITQHKIFDTKHAPAYIGKDGKLGG